MHQLNVLNKSASNEESTSTDQKDNVKENTPKLTSTTSSSFTSIDAERSPLFITSQSSIQHDRQEHFYQYGASSTDSATNAKKSPQRQTVTFSSEINIPSQARCSVLQVVQAPNKQPATKTIKTSDLNKPYLHLNFAHSFRHPVSGSLDETVSGAGNECETTGQLSAVQITNRGSTKILSSRSPPSQHHHTVLHQLPTSPFNQAPTIYNPNALNQQTGAYIQSGNQLTSPTYRTINLNAPLQTSGLSANDIYRGRKCFKRSISLASAQSHHHLSQQMSLTQPFAGGHHRRTNPLLGDYGRRRAYLDSFE